MHDRCQLPWPREDWPAIRQVALMIAAWQLTALLAVGALIVRIDPIRVVDAAPYATSTR